MAEKTKKDIGLDAKQPKSSCTSAKCPWHGHLKVRGRIFRGSVIQSRGLETAVVMWNRYSYVPKYERYERRKTKIAAHNPACIAAKTGDIVRIGECRPVSKSKSFVIFEKISEGVKK
jgi:small subunit ribosomal protein S17